MTPGEELSSLSFDKIIGGALDAVIKAQSNSSMTTVNFIRNTGFLKNDKGEVTEPIYVTFKYPKEMSPYIPAREAYFTLRVLSEGEGYAKENITGFKIGDTPVEVDVTVNDSGRILTAKLLSDGEFSDNAPLTITLAEGTEVKSQANIVCKKVEASEARPAVYEDMELKVPILTMLPVPFIRVAETDIEFNVKINSVSKNSDASADSSYIGGSASVGYKGFGVTANVNFNASMSSQKQKSSSEEVKKDYSLNIKVHAVQDEMPVGISRIIDILEESITPHAAARV